MTGRNIVLPLETALDTHVDTGVEVVRKRVNPLLAWIGADKSRVVAVLAPYPRRIRVARVQLVRVRGAVAVEY